MGAVFASCTPWRVGGICELLAGTRTIKAGLSDRWLDRRHAQSNSPMQLRESTQNKNVNRQDLTWLTKDPREKADTSTRVVARKAWRHWVPDLGSSDPSVDSSSATDVQAWGVERCSISSEAFCHDMLGRGAPEPRSDSIDSSPLISELGIAVGELQRFQATDAAQVADLRVDRGGSSTVRPRTKSVLQSVST